MKNIKNLWSGTTLYSELEKQSLTLAKALFTWGVLGTITGIASLIDLKAITFATIIFILLQLFIKVSSIGIYEGTSNLSVNKAIQKSELFANNCIFVISVIFYFVFPGLFSIASVFISIGTCLWSYKEYKKKKDR